MDEKTKALVIAEMNRRVALNGSLNWTDANEISEMFAGVKARSVTAMASRNKIPYARKVRTAKDGSAVVSKADIVSKIAVELDIETSALDGLDKSNKAALEAVLSALVILTSEVEDEAETED